MEKHKIVYTKRFKTAGGSSLEKYSLVYLSDLIISAFLGLVYSHLFLIVLNEVRLISLTVKNETCFIIPYIHP